MADETLGSFKIEFTSEGSEQVLSEINSIRDGLRQLEGELTSMKGLSFSGGGGGTIGGGTAINARPQVDVDVLKQFSDRMVDAGTAAELLRDGFGDLIANGFNPVANAMTLLNAAAMNAAAVLQGLSAPVGAGGAGAPWTLPALNTAPFDNAVGSLIGGLHFNAHGKVSRRSGLAGLQNQVEHLYRPLGGLGKRAGMVNRAFFDIVGQSTQDPATGKWTRTGSKNLIHAFDAVSKAALAAAVNLRKIKAAGGGAGPGGGSGPSGTTFLDLLIGRFKQQGKNADTIGGLVRQTNSFNSAMLTRLGGWTNMLGSVLGNLKAGPVGIAGVVASAGLKWLEADNSRRAQGEIAIHQQAQTARALRTKGLNADSVDDFSRAIRQSFIQFSPDNPSNPFGGSHFDAAKTAESAFQASAQLSGSLETDFSLLRTRGRIAPWMRSLMMQGVGLAGVTDQTSLLRRLGELRDSRSDDQWRTFVAESQLPSWLFDIAGGGSAEVERRLASKDSKGHKATSRGSKQMGKVLEYDDKISGEYGALNEAQTEKDLTTIAIANRGFSELIRKMKGEFDEAFAELDASLTQGIDEELFEGSNTPLGMKFLEKRKANERREQNSLMMPAKNVAMNGVESVTISAASVKLAGERLLAEQEARTANLDPNTPIDYMLKQVEKINNQTQKLDAPKEIPTEKRKTQPDVINLIIDKEKTAEIRGWDFTLLPIGNSILQSDTTSARGN